MGGVTQFLTKMKPDAPVFDGRLDPKAFSDWLRKIGDYFDSHNPPEFRKCKFAKMKLSGPAKLIACFLSTFQY